MPDDVVAQPTTTAPAPVTTDSAPAAVPAAAPQGYTGFTAPDPAAAAQPTTPTPDPVKDSPTAGDDKADQRVADAQRAMHAATQRTAEVEAQLAQILNHPLLGPVTKTVMAPKPEVVTEDPVVKAYKEYQQAPDDQTAFAKLVEFAETKAKASIMTELEQRAQRDEDARRTQQRDALIVQTINQKVTELAPEVPLPFFWAMSGQAEQETPAELTVPAKRLEWQMKRTIEIARAVLNQAWAPRQAAAAQAAAVAQSVAGIIPAGGAAPQGGGAAPNPVKSLVDAVKDSQRSQWSVRT